VIIHKEELAKLAKKVENFKNPVIFWQHARTNCLIMANSFFSPLKIWQLWAPIFPQKKTLCENHTQFSFFLSPSGPNSPQKKYWVQHFDK